MRTEQRDAVAQQKVDVERAVAALANVLPILRRLAGAVEGQSAGDKFAKTNMNQ